MRGRPDASCSLRGKNLCRGPHVLQWRERGARPSSARARHGVTLGSAWRGVDGQLQWGRLVQSMDRRVYPRYPMELPITFEGDEWAGEGSSRDVSAGGCRVQSVVRVEVGSYVRVKLYQNQDAAMAIELAAVRWVRGQEFGLEFLYMHPDQYDRLLSFAPASHPHANM